MGKKRVTVLGSEEEDVLKTKRATQLEQKKLRTGKTAKAPGLGGGQRIVDTGAESLAELDIIEAKSVVPEVIPAASPKKTAKPAKVRSSAYKQAKTKISSQASYPIPEALVLLKEVSLTKFDPTVELHLTLSKSGVRQNVDLPYKTGKTKRIAIADDTTVSDITAGKINFDILLASPVQMAKLVKLAKVLGPKGLMPNPKTGTVVDDPAGAAKKLAGSSIVMLQTEKSAPVIHTVVGKLSQPEKELLANITAITTALAASGLIKIVLKSTMSPAIKLQI